MELTLELPPKSLFKADEICSLMGIRPYVLRFWEAEFEDISPVISATGQKLYERKDIKIIAIIKNLLFEKKYSIEKARLEIKNILRQQKEELREEQMVSPLPESPSVDQEKLWMAKEKLLSAMSMIQSIQHNHNWF